MDEQVHFRKEDAEIGMAVIPADDSLSGVLLVQDALHVSPGLCRECDPSELAGSEFAPDARFNVHKGAVVISNNVPHQNAANLCVEAGMGVGMDIVQNRAAHNDLEAGLPL